jgi:hypothetical protein
MNMGKWDRSIRAVIGIGLLIIAFLLLNGLLQVIFWIVGSILLLTAVVGLCPMYSLFHISTRK